MSLFQADPLGATAQICIAYETLRDPIKRREYDRSLGLDSEDKPVLRQWTVPIAQPRWTPFLASVDKDVAEEPASNSATIVEPHVTVGSRAEAPVDPRLAAIASSVRELAKPPTPGPSAESSEEPRSPQPRFDEAPEMPVEELIRQIRIVGHAEKYRLHHAERATFDWKKPAFILGGLVVGAGLFGAMVGLSLKDDVAPAQADAFASHIHRPATPLSKPVASSPALVASAVAIPPAAQVHGSAAPGRTMRRDLRERRAKLFGEQMAESLAAPSAPAETATDDAASDQTSAAPVQRIAAEMPLPRAVVARTIERIGYSCGEVASTSSVEGGAPGVFRVTCTSGNSYQATPVGGRYRFRRVAD